MRQLAVEQVSIAPYSISGARVFGKEVAVRKVNKVLKYLLESTYKENINLFTKILNSGKLYVIRYKEQKSIIGNTAQKHLLSQPSPVTSSGIYIDTMISRQEALEILKRLVEYLGIENQIFLILED